MAGRRAFLKGVLAASVCPYPTWADAGNPSYLSAAERSDGTFVLCGLSATGKIVFERPLPARGHAAAAHPARPDAVAFARRPGRFAIVIDCLSGRTRALLDAPTGRHFYGHGTFSGDGHYLFTTENDYEAARGVIGVWDVTQDYQRVGEFASGGVGPHDLKILPDGVTLVVANGGIETHPEAGRTKLNLSTMRPNLSYLSALDGDLLEQYEPPAKWFKSSIRHLAVGPDGAVAIACQWQGDVQDAPPLVATHRRGTSLEFHQAQDGLEREMMGYAGSIALSADGARIAATGPRGGVALLFGRAGAFSGTYKQSDICGVAPSGRGFAFTSGTGRFWTSETGHGSDHAGALRWDNHLIPLPNATT